ncbi:hypothetical protein DFJ77DRAFT_348532 [Powellomyces hirtus]|nr:hypothetical protein DFJ77DRAFT_348532 [Powellomyces hirtus]
MWDAAASYDASAMEPAAYDPAAASAACYGTADWSTYQYGGEAAAGFLEAPPGVDPAPPGVDEQQVALEQEWAIQAQEYADAAKADNAAGSADHQRVSSEGGVHAPVTATSSPDAAVAAGGSAKGQEDHSQYQGYDYTAYAGSYGYYGPNAAYYGNNGYQYGAGQQAGYGQADYYSSAYAAAAAVPKEIHNPFEDLGKPKADKADEAKAPLNRRGPVRRKIIMPISKKISEEQKLKSASSIAKQNNDSSTPVSGQDSTANTTVKPDKTMVKEVDANAENIMKTARAESEGAKNLNSSTAPSRSSSEKSTQEKENLLQAHNAAALKARDAVERKPINNQYALEMDREQKAATIQEGQLHSTTSSLVP